MFRMLIVILVSKGHHSCLEAVFLTPRSLEGCISVSICYFPLVIKNKSGIDIELIPLLILYWEYNIMTVHNQIITENLTTANGSSIDIKLKPAILLLYPSVFNNNIPLTYLEIENNLVICCRRYNLDAYKPEFWIR